MRNPAAFMRWSMVRTCPLDTASGLIIVKVRLPAIGLGFNRRESTVDGRHPWNYLLYFRLSC